MSSQPVTIPLELTVDGRLLKEALRAVLHTILFHRVFANIKPRDMTIVNFTYPIIDDAEVERMVEEKIPQFVKSVQTNPQSKGQIGLRFYEKRTERRWVFSSTSSEVCWEQWAITINVMQSSTEKEQRRSMEVMESSMSAFFSRVLHEVNEQKDHIPPITTSDGNPFPYQIVIPTQADTWGSMFKRILDSSNPTAPGHLSG